MQCPARDLCFLARTLLLQYGLPLFALAGDHVAGLVPYRAERQNCSGYWKVLERKQRDVSQEGAWYWLELHLSADSL